MPGQSSARTAGASLKPSDGLKRLQAAMTSRRDRAVLWSVCVLVGLTLVWACLAPLDIVTVAEGKLARQTLVKVVQPSDAGVVREWLVKEGDVVKAGQVLAKLDATLAAADGQALASELMTARIGLRSLDAELHGTALVGQSGDDPAVLLFQRAQHAARRRAQDDALSQEQALLQRAEREWRSAREVLFKLEQVVPLYRESAAVYARLQREGYYGGLAAAEKQRELVEKEGELTAQRSIVAAAEAGMQAQQKKCALLESNYRSELQRQAGELRQRISQLEPALEKARYRSGQMTLTAPQDGVVKDIASTTAGAVVQPGAALITLVPASEALYADVVIRNEDLAFLAPGQDVRLKVAAYPFQRYGMLGGVVRTIAADAQDPRPGNVGEIGVGASPSPAGGYRARIALVNQVLVSPAGNSLPLTPGMHVIAEVHQGQRTVMEYLLSPVQKVVQEAARER